MTGVFSKHCWRTCATTHCIAGWAVHLADAYELEAEVGVATAGLVLLGPQAAAHFFDTDKDAAAYLRAVLEQPL